MFVYFILLAIIIVFATEENKKNKNWLSFIVFLLVFALFSFRSYKVGSDTSRYIFEYISQSSELREVDVGFTKYNELLYSLGFSTRQYLMMTSLLICFPIYFYIEKVSDKKNLTYFLYITIGIFVFNLSGIRQSLAVSILILGYLSTLYVRRKWIKYIIIAGFVLLAALFHASAIFCLVLIPMLWASQKHFKLNKILFVFFIVTPLVLPFTGFFESFLVNKMIARYESYEADSSKINVVSYFVIPYVIFVYLTLLKYFDKRTSFSPTENFAYLCAFMYVVCAAASFYIPILNRMEYYFSLPMNSLIPTLTSRLSVSYRNFILSAIVVVCVLFFFIGQTDGTMRIDNYKFSLD